MEHIAALLLVVGCSDAFAQCRELPVPVSIFETQEECAEDLRPAIAGLTGKRANVLGQCVYVDPAMDEEDAELVWRVEAGGRLMAKVVTADRLVAWDAHEGVKAEIRQE